MREDNGIKNVLIQTDFMPSKNKGKLIEREKIKKNSLPCKKTLMEKMERLYRFAEFGHLSSGLFHDLLNPLTAITLNLEELTADNQKEIDDAKFYINQAIASARKMAEFLSAIKKRIKNQPAECYFCLNQEIEQIIQIYTFKAKKSGVELIFTAKEQIYTLSDTIKFNQLISSLISNAIDSFETINDKRMRKVLINLSRKNNSVYLTVQDWGCGIPEKNLNLIFEPFFTTKNLGEGSGIGLTAAKNIAEKDFNGKIYLETKVEEGTKFFVEFPIKEHT